MLNGIDVLFTQTETKNEMVFSANVNTSELQKIRDVKWSNNISIIE